MKEKFLVKPNKSQVNDLGHSHYTVPDYKHKSTSGKFVQIEQLMHKPK